MDQSELSFYYRHKIYLYFLLLIEISNLLGINNLLEEKTALTPEEETTLYLNAVDAAFTTPDEKIRLRALIQK